MGSNHPDGLVRSVLLAAGRGKRLRPLTDQLPKPAVPLLDVPLAAYALARLAPIAPPVVMNLSHLAERAREALHPYLSSASVEIMMEPAEPFGSGGTLAVLRERVAESLLTYNSDLLSDLDLDGFVAAHRRLGALATLAVREVEEGADLAVDGDRAARFIDRRRRQDSRGALYLGVAMFQRDALNLLSDDKPLGLGESLIAPLVAASQVAVFRHDGYALDVGTLERYLQGSLDVLNGRLPEALERLPGAILEVDGGVAYRGPDVRVHDDAIGPGAVLLRGCSVAPGAFVENAVVWPRENVPAVTLRDTIWAIGDALL